MDKWTVNTTPLILVGDHYLHLDVTDDYASVKLLHILEVHGLTQHVLQPTHDRGHTLDVFITRSDQSVLSLNVDPPALSDHSPIVASVNLQVFHRYTVSRVAWRCWRSLDVNTFADDLVHSALVQSPPSDVYELFAITMILYVHSSTLMYRRGW